MKRVLSIITTLLIAICSSAQGSQTYRDRVTHLHFNAEFNISASDFIKGKPDFGIYAFTVSPGYRFNDNWSVYVPISMDVVLMNRQSIKNFVENGTLGLGGSYSLTMKKHTAIEFALSGSSTYTRSDLNYFKARAAVNFGFHGIGGAPYVGVGCSYLCTYNRTGNSKVCFEATIGFTIF